MTGDSVLPSRLPDYAAERANALYEAIQWAENEAYRLAEALDGLSEDPEVRKRRTAARRIHRRIFTMLDAVEATYHANDGHLVERQAEPSD